MHKHKNRFGNIGTKFCRRKRGQVGYTEFIIVSLLFCLPEILHSKPANQNIVTLSVVRQPQIKFSTDSFIPFSFQPVVVQSPRCAQLFGTPWTEAWQVSLSLTISRNLPKFMFIASVMLSSHIILWWPLLLLLSIFPSIREFPISWLFASDDQNTGASASASVLPVNIHFSLQLSQKVVCSQPGGTISF